MSKDSHRIFIEHGEKLEGLLADNEMGLVEDGIRCIQSDGEIYEATYNALNTYNREEVNILEGNLDPKNIFLSYFSLEEVYEPFMSTLSFIETLTNISNIIMRHVDKKGVLQEELKKVNSKLPSCVYIPFSNPKIRESFILHIPVQEAKVFTTKERAPYFICIEVFQPLIEYQLTKTIHKNHVSRSVSESQSRSYSANLLHETPSLVEKAVIETIDPTIPKISLAQSLLMPDRRPVSCSVDGPHYERFNYKSDITQSLGAFYDVNEETKSEDIIKSFKQQAERIRKSSPYGTLKTWALIHVIVKSGDDLRQEQLAMQMISFFLQTFKEKHLKLWLYAYDIIATGLNCGILECVPDAISLDALKKATERKTLLEHFITQYGGEDSRYFKKARKEFMKSLAGYSLLCYFLQIKDRHNGNILLDRLGHLIHIDFGFMLSNSPGGNMNFEKAPFKLTDEFEMLMGGRRSALFIKFRSLCVKGYIALKEKSEQICLMVEMLKIGSGVSLGCFSGGDQATKGLKDRLVPRERMSERDCKMYINELIDESLDNWSTRCYDKFQYCCQNIFY